MGLPNSVKSPNATLARVMRFLVFASLFGLAYSVPSNRNCGETIKLDPQEIVDVHNRYRAEVASGKIHGHSAKNMKLIKWDEELAAKAQDWANTCPSGHSHNGLGENIYWSWSSGDIKANGLGAAASEAWANERHDVGSIDELSPSYVFKSGTGHWTQMIWAETDKVGCGAVKSLDGSWNKATVVCNYSPAGNFLRRPVFEFGTPCSGCSSGCDANGILC